MNPFQSLTKKQIDAFSGILQQAPKRMIRWVKKNRSVKIAKRAPLLMFLETRRENCAIDYRYGDLVKREAPNEL